MFCDDEARAGCVAVSGKPESDPPADDSAPVLPGTDIPAPSVARLAAYLHVLRSFSERGVLIASSGELARAAGVNPSILRKDLSHVGANGVRGVGYDVGRLTARIAMALHTDSVHTVALAGAGRLGHALLAHTGFGRGFRVAALFDDDPVLIGTVLQPGGPTVAPLADIERVCATLPGPRVEVAVIATADADAQRAFDAFVAVGVRQVLNVTPVSLVVAQTGSADSGESDVVIRQVDLALELQVLAFQASRSPSSPDSERSSRGRRQASGMGEETVTA
ncbi:Rex DNA-binding domain protein [Gordonia bronchialis DSM 43247]|uniref:Redox-sensing transcriptional repressor Rex n=1 Tax=Gordonia bronchialis (strain ATCC 25592 / DSM 43247 / BCRC 13721 / JCM 3198 / KCTC 3076 / NBRC 16047 / NCTC 10667) TaxID=526226 RepID=D0L499_GORB4|nr:Rex DNA-binding domain protein [Gordonia bronchialis DSM 43247]QGS25868.1 redox-sensing transcriptional repressor Rex [Gordonia bronchialis]UAK37733.1 redox-sensing transcriptional repressor Rex [Gordonia bronchialis]STQ63126.1 Redox-sensing transcriptional repressor rex [Gordonia bronchialis]